jgi:hypothetical protein
VKLLVTAAVDPSKSDDGFAIKAIVLEREGSVSGLNAQGFRDLAEKAKTVRRVSIGLTVMPITLAATPA